MKRARQRVLAAAAAVALVGGAWAGFEYGFTERAQAQGSGYEGAHLTWYGPLGITRADTALFNYSNFAPEGTPAVGVEWAFSDALTGELIVGNFGKPRKLEAMKGVIWTLDGMDAVMDGKRRQLVGWLRVTYPNRAAKRRAVDLGTIEVYDSMTFGSSLFVGANPSAPGDKYAFPDNTEVPR